MLQPSDVPNFEKETLGPYGGSKLRMENLECDQSVMPDVAGEIDRGHAAPTQLALEQVPVS
jgi:hypothetical protein